MTFLRGESKLLSYEIQGFDKVKFSWQMNLPKSQNYLVTDNGKIYIIYVDGKKPITYVKSSNFHRTIDKSQFPIPQFQAVGFCNTAKHGNKFSLVCEPPQPFFDISIHHIWVFKKQKWIKINTAIGIAARSCFCGINRDTIFYISRFYDHYSAATVNFKTEDTSILNNFSGEMWDWFDPLTAGSLACSHIKDKSFNKVAVIMSHLETVRRDRSKSSWIVYVAIIRPASAVLCGQKMENRL